MITLVGPGPSHALSQSTPSIYELHKPTNSLCYCYFETQFKCSSVKSLYFYLHIFQSFFRNLGLYWDYFLIYLENEEHQDC